MRASLQALTCWAWAITLFQSIYCEPAKHPPPITDKNNAANYKTVREIWLSHSHPFLIDKWLEYGDVYEKFLPRPLLTEKQMEKNPGRKEIRLLEMGVQSGGSLIDWKRYFGDRSTIVGVDIDPQSFRSNMPEENIFVMTGSVLDKDFLLSVCEKHGPFDVIIDDAGHTAEMIRIAISVLFKNETCLGMNYGDEIYVVEDLHTSVMKKYFISHRDFSHAILAEGFRAMHSHWAESPDESKLSWIFQNKLVGMYSFDSITFFQKGLQKDLHVHRAGTDSWWNMELVYNKPGTYHIGDY